MHASLNVGYQGKSGPGKIHEVILVDIISELLVTRHCRISNRKGLGTSL